MKKIVCLFLVLFISQVSIINVNAFESATNNRIVTPKYGSFVTYQYNFCNFQITTASAYSIIGANGGINITLNPNVSNSNYKMTFELVRNGVRTGNIKTVPMTSAQLVSWGQLPAGKYQIKMTSTYANSDKGIYAIGTIKVYYRD